MKWVIAVVEGERLLFRGSTRDPDELQQVAEAARQMRPTAIIYLRSSVPTTAGSKMESAKRRA